MDGLGENNVPSLTFKKPSDKYVFDSLYTTPPQRKPMTDEQIAEVAERMEATDAASSFWREFARAIEAAQWN